MDIDSLAPRLPRMIRAAMLLLAAALLLLVLLAGWLLIDQQRQLAEGNGRTDTLISSLRDADHDAAQDRRTAARNQRALLDYTKALADRQDALLAYLRGHGIQLPARLVTVVPPPRIVTVPRHHRPSSKSSRPRSGSTPTGPGKSGAAPGHRKHHHH